MIQEQREKLKELKQKQKEIKQSTGIKQTRKRARPTDPTEASTVDPAPSSDFTFQAEPQSGPVLSSRDDDGLSHSDNTPGNMLFHTPAAPQEPMSFPSVQCLGTSMDPTISNQTHGNSVYWPGQPPPVPTNIPSWSSALTEQSAPAMVPVLGHQYQPGHYNYAIQNQAEFMQGSSSGRQQNIQNNPSYPPHNSYNPFW